MFIKKYWLFKWSTFNKLTDLGANSVLNTDLGNK